jgi:hypothetical protein
MNHTPWLAALGLLCAFFAAPAGAPAAAPSAALAAASALRCRGLFNPLGTWGTFCATGSALPLGAFWAFVVPWGARPAAFFRLLFWHGCGSGLRGGLPGAPALHRPKSKPVGGCGLAPRFAASCFRDAPLADAAKVLKSKALCRCKGALLFAGLRASGCGREAANRTRGTAATEPEHHGMACSAPLAPARPSGQRAPRAALPRGLVQRPSLFPCP